MQERKASIAQTLVIGLLLVAAGGMAIAALSLGCGERALTPADLDKVGIFSVKFDAEDAMSSTDCGDDAETIRINMTKSEGPGVPTIFLDFVDTPLWAEIGGPEATKIAIFNRGGDSEGDCDGGDGGSVVFTTPVGGGVSHEEAQSWLIPNPTESDLEETIGNGLPMIYVVTIGGDGSGPGHRGESGEVRLNGVLIPDGGVESAMPPVTGVARSSAPILGSFALEEWIPDAAADRSLIQDEITREELERAAEEGQVVLVTFSGGRFVVERH